MKPTFADATDSVYVFRDAVDILFADDDPILREFAEVHLSTDRSSVRTAANGREALEKIAAKRPDLLLLDIEMPEMDGFQVLARLEADPELCRIPVIVVTGREDVAAIDRAYRGGATSFVVKPLNWRQLTYQVRYVHRTAVNEATLALAHNRSRKAAEQTSRRFESLVNLTTGFVTDVLRRQPTLTPLAADFAAAVGELTDRRPDSPRVPAPAEAATA